MSVDLSEFLAHRSRVGPLCWYQLIQLTDEQRAKLDAAMATETISGAAITAVLANWGHKMASQSIQRHRQGKCSCE